MGEILITGGNGFIGSHVVKCFAESGEKVVCLIRKNSDISLLEGVDVEYRYGDITDFDSVERAMDGADFIIHISAYVKDWGNYEDFYKTNVEGTLNVLKSAKKHGIKNVIITGTNSVYGEEDYAGIKNEESPHNSHYNYFMDKIFPCKMNYYRDTKTIAKEKAASFALENSINMTIIEPVWVYGEGETHGGFYEYVKSAQEKIPLMPGSKSNKFPVIYAGDLAKAYYTAYLKKLAGVNSFIIGNRKTELMCDIYEMFCKEAGVKKPGNLPKIFAYPLAFKLELLYTIFNIKKVPLLTRGRVNMFYDNNEFSTDKALQILGFEAKTPLNEGIAKTIKWYKEKGLL